MIPLRDENPGLTVPYVTIGLIVTNGSVYLWELLSMSGWATTYGAVPATLFHGIGPGALVTVATSMFLHGGFLHLAGNMLYLWIFGNNIEDVLGHARFLGFYLVCGAIAVYSHALTVPSSQVPMIGASGAIAGVLGAYLVCFPRARVLTLVPMGFYVEIIRLPAVIVLGFWIVVQFVSGGLSAGAEGAGVAWFAHIGGFLAGMGLILTLRRRDSLKKP